VGLPASCRVSVPRSTQDSNHKNSPPLTGLSPASVCLSSAVLLGSSLLLLVLQPPRDRSHLGLGSSAFARHYSRNTLFSSGYLDVSVPRVPRSRAIYSPVADLAFPKPGFPIRTSTAHSSSTTPRRFSQCYTSFIGT
jgi:hypothetical protein